MPEKPEVITVAKSLATKILGKTISDCQVYWDNIIASPSVEEFCRQIVGEQIKSIDTRGKWIVIELTTKSLLIHLRMEGKFFFRQKDAKRQKHEHVIFLLDQEISFRYHDVRKFGKMYLVEKKEVFNIAPLKELGYEYNDDRLTSKYLYQKIHHKKLPIKTVLLDQSIIAGIGNIYDDEILFLSHLHPLTKAEDLSQRDCQRLIENTQLVLAKAIALGGTTIRSFTSSEGVHGLFQNELFVHGKDRQSCPHCGKNIEKIKVGGRGTYFCPKCQKVKNKEKSIINV